MTQQGVVLFHTTSAVMRAEKLLKQAGVGIRLIPTPRQFSTDCGIALRFAWDERDRVVQALQAGRVDVDAVHLMEPEEASGR